MRAGFSPLSRGAEAVGMGEQRRRKGDSEDERTGWAEQTTEVDQSEREASERGCT